MNIGWSFLIFLFVCELLSEYFKVVLKLMFELNILQFYAVVKSNESFLLIKINAKQTPMICMICKIKY